MKWGKIGFETVVVRKFHDLSRFLHRKIKRSKIYKRRKNFANDWIFSKWAKKDCSDQSLRQPPLLQIRKQVDWFAIKVVSTALRQVRTDIWGRDTWGRSFEDGYLRSDIWGRAFEDATFEDLFWNFKINNIVSKIRWNF